MFCRPVPGQGAAHAARLLVAAQPPIPIPGLVALLEARSGASSDEDELELSLSLSLPLSLPPPRSKPRRGRQQVRDRLPVRDRVGGEVTRSVATLGKKLQRIGHPSAGEHDKLEA